MVTVVFRTSKNLLLATVVLAAFKSQATISIEKNGCYAIRGKVTSRIHQTVTLVVAPNSRSETTIQLQVGDKIGASVTKGSWVRARAVLSSLQKGHTKHLLQTHVLVDRRGVGLKRLDEGACL
jgi:hypothetical protein